MSSFIIAQSGQFGFHFVQRSNHLGREFLVIEALLQFPLLSLGLSQIVRQGISFFHRLFQSSHIALYCG